MANAQTVMNLKQHTTSAQTADSTPDDRSSRSLNRSLSMTTPIAVDAMGGDYAPHAVVEGAVECARRDNVRVTLVGDESQIASIIRSLNATSLLENKTIQIVHTESGIAMDEKPALARRKLGSSMHVACELVAQGLACGALSAGNSGAMMTIAVLTIGRLEGVVRPAIATLMPSRNGFSIVTDAGANVNCTPEMLVQFAIFGSAFAKGMFGLEKPRVALISNGEEEGKGNDLTRSALELIRKTDMACEGYGEGRDIFEGKIDVFVCDGFTGNVLLKTAEGTAHFFAKSLRDSIKSGSAFSRFGAWLMRPVFDRVKTRMDAREYGSAPLLGLKAPVFIAHGNSDAYAIRKAILFVSRSHQGHVAKLIEADLKKVQVNTEA